MNAGGHVTNWKVLIPLTGPPRSKYICVNTAGVGWLPKDPASYTLLIKFVQLPVPVYYSKFTHASRQWRQLCWVSGERWVWVQRTGSLSQCVVCGWYCLRVHQRRGWVCFSVLGFIVESCAKGNNKKTKKIELCFRHFVALFTWTWFLLKNKTTSKPHNEGDNAESRQVVIDISLRVEVQLLMFFFNYYSSVIINGRAFTV